MSESESEVLSTLLTRLYMRPHTASNQVLSFSLLFLKVNGSSGCNLVLRLYKWSSCQKWPKTCRQHALVIIVQHSEALLGEKVPPLITVIVLDMMATSAPIEIIAQSFEIALPNRPLD